MFIIIIIIGAKSMKKMRFTNFPIFPTAYLRNYSLREGTTSALLIFCACE
jgi:hypothetical protein